MELRLVNLLIICISTWNGGVGLCQLKSLASTANLGLGRNIGDCIHVYFGLSWLRLYLMRALLFSLSLFSACGLSFGDGKVDLLKKIVNSRKFGEIRDSVDIDLNREDAKDLLRQVSRSGDLRSLQDTALKLWNGTSREDRQKALSIMQQAARQGDPKALHFIGSMIQSGQILAKDPQEAIKWLGRSAALGHTESQANMGRHFLEGEDYTKAFTWLSVAVANGATPENMQMLQEASKHLSPEQMQSAQSLVQKLIKKFPGSLQAGAELPVVDPSMASSATSEDSSAAVNADGTGSAPKAAGTGSPEAEGEESTPGTSASTTALGAMTATQPPNESEPPSDYVQVMQSAWNGDPDAQFKVASMFHYGNQVAKDHKTAMKWYMSSATKGNPEAQSRLGLMYFNGHGGPKDLVSAYAWFSVATANKDPNADKLRHAISRNLQPEQLATAHNLAQQLVNQYPGLLPQ